MSENCLFHQILFSQLSIGQCSKGAQRKQYKDTLKVTPKHGGINTSGWEEQAADCSVRHHPVHQGVHHFEAQQLDTEVERRRQRKEKETNLELRILLPRTATCLHC